MKSEVERIRRKYAQYDEDVDVQALWAPFSEVEVAHRSQQYMAMADLFRRIGKLSLSGLRILDVGCGQGRIIRACLDIGATPENVVGVDIRANAIDEARRLSPHLDFRLATGIDLDLGKGEFDLVMQFVVFSSIFAPDLRRHLASEMLRVLKPGGYIFWWDCVKTNEGKRGQVLVPVDLFPGMPHSGLAFAIRPRPSYCLKLPRPLRWLGRLIDYCGYPSTHTASLLGPKASPN